MTDTATKRASAMNFGSGDLLPVPNNSIAQEDRQTMADMYGGILAGEPVVIIPGGHTVYDVLKSPLRSPLIKPLCRY